MLRDTDQHSIYHTFWHHHPVYLEQMEWNAMLISIQSITRFGIITLLYLEQMEWNAMLISIQSITLLFQKCYTCFWQCKNNQTLRQNPRFTTFCAGEC